ncbi:MAG: DUF1287 domain-containing protein [Candidatus Eisenbacteria bacterium]|nr:DUF1287 domain-containing protein [Candidatus Eisenbacteria bacterium]
MGYYRSPGEGVCTDVVLDAFFSAGIDLRTLLAEDIRAHREEYPFAEGNSIDARRARVLVDWFRRHWEPLPLDRDFLPGDVVFYTGTYRSDGVADHVGIVSDKSSSEGVPLIIDNFPDPGYVSETADVFCAEMIGHFRVRSEGNSDTGSPE